MKLKLVFISIVVFSFLKTIPNEPIPTIQSIIALIEHSKAISKEDSIWTEIDKKLELLDKETALLTIDSIYEYCTLNSYKIEQGNCQFSKAKRLKREGDYYDSYLLYEKSVELFKAAKYQQGLIKAYNGLGILFKVLDDYNKSLSYYKLCEELFTNSEANEREGYLYLNIGSLLIKSDSLALAKRYLMKSKNIMEHLNDTNILSCFINLGELYLGQNQIDSALFNYRSAYEISKIFGNPNDKFQAIYHLADFYFENNRHSDALPLYFQADSIASDTIAQNYIPVQVLETFYSQLTKIYNGLNDFENENRCLRLTHDFNERNKRQLSIMELYKSQFFLLMQKRYQDKKISLLILGITVGILLVSILFIFILYRNYRQKQKANRLLTEMDELKTRLFSDISHEMRTPLTLILGPLEQMLSDEAKKKPGKRQVKLMRKNANSILNLVNQMLDLSKIDAKNMKLELVEQDVVKFIRVRFAAFYSMAEQKQIEFNCYLPNDKKIRFFDAEKLEKIINNLVSNAIKFTPEKGQVFCFASFPRNNKLELTIQDTGEGIPQKELSKIFDRFHQVKGENGYKNIGTGIGLALTKELVQIMHGQINVESVVGEGTKFKVEITLGKEHLNESEFSIIKAKSKTESLANVQQEETTDSDPEIKTENTELPLVLVVDDQVEIRNFIKENLLENYSVETASNGLEGFELAVNSIPDLIITDLMMPEMDGNRMCKKLKQDERTSHIPIIVLTAKSEEIEKIKSLETGAEAFLSKPFNIKELKLRVYNTIEQRKKLRERFARNIRLEPKEIAVASADEKFLSKAMEVIEQNIGNSEFEVSHFQEEMFMSRMQLFRKIKALTNQSPGEFIRTIRLKRAASLMDQKFGNIAQITFEVGFNNPSYFAKCFKDLFGKLPSEYMKNNTN